MIDGAARKTFDLLVAHRRPLGAPRRSVVLPGVAALAAVAAVVGFGGSPSFGDPASGADGFDVMRVVAPAPQAHGRWAERTAVAGDLNGDGVTDVFVGNPAQDAETDKNVGRVYLLSGKALAEGRSEVVYEISPAEPQAGAAFGFFLSVLDDVNKDGKPDLAVGTDAQDVGDHMDQGKAWVFSGADGQMLYALDNPAPQGPPVRIVPEGQEPTGHRARFGSRIGRAGDVTADGVSDLVVGASGNDMPAGCSDATDPATRVPEGCRTGQGQAFIFDGVTGALVRTLDLPNEDQQAECQSACGSFGLSVQGPGDSDGDGVSDQLISAPSYAGVGRMYLFSGKTGQLVLKIDDPVPQKGAVFGFQDAAPLAPGDVDGDGLADLYGNGFIQNLRPTGTGEGQAWVFSGKTGAMLYELHAPVPQDGAQFGFSMVGAGSAQTPNPELYVGSSPHHVPGAAGSGGTYVFNAKDGSLRHTLELPESDLQLSTPKNLGPNLGWTVSAPGDLNADGKPDYLAGAPFADVGANQDQGLLYVFLSRPPTSPSSDRTPSRSPAGPVAVITLLLIGAGVVAVVLWRTKRSNTKPTPPAEGG